MTARVWLRVDPLFTADVKLLVSLFLPGAQFTSGAPATDAALAQDELAIVASIVCTAADVCATVTLREMVNGLSALRETTRKLSRGERIGQSEQRPLTSSATSETPLPSTSSVTVETLRSDDPHTDRKLRVLMKRALRFALHEALAATTGRRLTWGLLTGVRPVKLLHEWQRQAGQKSEEALRERLQREYLVSPERAALAAEIAVRERAAVPDLETLDREVSIYIGIPFCPTHCAYCTFPAYSMVDKARYAFTFLDALLQEIKMVGRVLREKRVGVTTVYVGGGTPSSLRPDEMRRLFDALRTEVGGAWREFCVEAGRADTITPDRVAAMAEYGVDRVSVNPQSYHHRTLRMMGRGHSPEIIDRRFALVREAGIRNINMDLILGLPGETGDDVAYSVERTLALDPDSVTLHTLSFKRSSEVTEKRESLVVPDDEAMLLMMRAADHAVRSAGLLPYYLYRQRDILGNLENVGYAKPGFEGIYNIAIIEEAQTIIALGGGAASKWVEPVTRRITRHDNPREPLAYVNAIERVLAVKERALIRICEQIGAAH
ncbi:coproporphyrinogen dehydrogenase HemZ [Ferroacidibacillus organovorans]|uniref:Coproporphyrinogen dehydrogenase HemZ n=1 Tax=Ferroacidibacillus organovorans TaxID=1765683 RepID=A0A1V4EVW9_9BACL|nr:coproporphyrinogen dehydrogenase HemZ [Ferroacidibacillus organovorans]OPG17075.1 coproporphyrinogen dehydrogenase HemZ [Ferroacidibacillus organovorans]